MFILGGLRISICFLELKIERPPHLGLNCILPNYENRVLLEFFCHKCFNYLHKDYILGKLDGDQVLVFIHCCNKLHWHTDYIWSRLRSLWPLWFLDIGLVIQYKLKAAWAGISNALTIQSKHLWSRQYQQDKRKLQLKLWSILKNE